MKRIEDIVNKIHCADCLEFMNEMPDGCVDMAITSPPYWGLRDYGVEQIFGGNGDCEHEWGSCQIEHDALRYRGHNASVGSNKNPEIHPGKEGSGGNYCQKCQAWKGQLGLEPTPELYIEHLTEIFNEVKRVLKKEGVLFLNIGDTYASSSSGAPVYGNDGKVPGDCPLHDSPLNRPCDGCQAVSVLRKFHKPHSPSPELSDDLHGPIQEHRESENDHVANSDFLNQKQPRQSSVAIQDQKHLSGHVDEQLLDVQESTIDESSQLLQDECLQRGNSFSGQLKSGSFSGDVQESAYKKDDNGDIKENPSASEVHTSGRVHNVCPYLYSATPSLKLQPKCLCMIPERLTWSLIQNGWILRNKIIWYKPNAMPSSVTDRFSNRWEYIFLFSKSQRYYFDLDAVREEHKWDIVWSRKGSGEGTPYEQNNPRSRWGMTRREAKERKWENVPGQDTQSIENHSGYFDKNGKCLVNPLGKNPGDVFEINTQPFPEAHFAVFPEKLCEKPIKAGCPEEVCKKCGKARERIIEVDRSNCEIQEWDEIENNLSKKVRGGIEGDLHKRKNISDIFAYSIGAKRETIGYTDCNCNAGFEGGIVLDPFAGAGTALYIAKEMRRRFIGIDIKQEYCDMAETRTAQGVL